MREFNYTITDEQGLHARPAGLLMKQAVQYPCKVTIIKEGREMDAKKIFGIMSLAVKKGQEITIRTDGEQEETAINDLQNFAKDNL